MTMIFEVRSIYRLPLIHNSVEETLNALLDKEADKLANAEKLERSSDRRDIVPAIISEISTLPQAKSN